MAKDVMINNKPGNNTFGNGNRPKDFGPGDLPVVGTEKNIIGGTPRPGPKGDGVDISVKTPMESPLMATNMAAKYVNTVDYSTTRVADDSATYGAGAGVPVAPQPRPTKSY